MHSIHTRAATSDERRMIAARSRPELACYGCITIFFGIVPAFVLGRVGSWLGGMISPEASKYGQWIGWLIAASLWAGVLVSFTRLEHRRRKRAVQDRESELIQEIRVTDPRVVEIGLINDNEPILALDIGDGKIL